MGIMWFLAVFGLIASGAGLAARSPWLALAAPVGWLAFLGGLAGLLVPGFWG